MTSLAMNRGYRFESMQSSGMRQLAKLREISTKENDSAALNPSIYVWVTEVPSGLRPALGGGSKRECANGEKNLPVVG
jgi:hypothetical protein